VTGPDPLVQKSAMAKPLEDLVVLDVTLAFAGPLASLLLAGLGATVIKVERPKTGDLSRTNPPYLGRKGVSLGADEPDDLALPFINRSRGKLSVTLDLKKPEGVQIFMDLARRADVLLENNSTGMLDSLGLGYEAISLLNPAIVYCSVSGFGREATGPDRRAFDLMIQALSGVMGATGEEGGAPMRQGIVVGDIMAPLMAVIGILSALRERGRSGLGQHVDVSMLDALTSLVAAEHFDALAECGVPTRTGNSLARMAPFGAYPTRTGHVAICAPSDEFMDRLAHAIGREEILADARFSSRHARTLNRAELDRIIQEWTETLDAEEVVARLNSVDVPSAEVRSPLDAVRDPGVVNRGGVVPLRHPTHGITSNVAGTGLPIRFSRSDAGFEGLDAPFLGEHNAVIYGELLGYDDERLRHLQADGVI
jgi:CoA:oxalate CoA-transferase